MSKNSGHTDFTSYILLWINNKLWVLFYLSLPSPFTLPPSIYLPNCLFLFPCISGRNHHQGGWVRLSFNGQLSWPGDRALPLHRHHRPSCLLQWGRALRSWQESPGEGPQVRKPTHTPEPTLAKTLLSEIKELWTMKLVSLCSDFLINSVLPTTDTHWPRVTFTTWRTPASRTSTSLPLPSR